MSREQIAAHFLRSLSYGESIILLGRNNKKVRRTLILDKQMSEELTKCAWEQDVKY